MKCPWDAGTAADRKDHARMCKALAQHALRSTTRRHQPRAT